MSGTGVVVKGARKWPRAARRALSALPRTLREDLGTAAFGPLPRTHRQRPGWMDWLPALVLLLVLGAAMLAIGSANQLNSEYGLSTSSAVLLGLIQSAALVVAVFRPVQAWWAATVVMVVIAWVSAPPGAEDVPLPWTLTGIVVQAGVLFLMALRLRPRVAVAALTISLLAGVACSALASPVSAQATSASGHDIGFAGAALVLIAAVVVGAALRGGQVARGKLVAQEELTAEERSRRTLLEERNRIARELHDVVAHHMSVISIQAQVAPHLVENPSEELKENLAGIRGSSKEALTELRRVLGVLRSEDSLARGVLEAPQPTLGRLEELVGTVRGTGLAVALEIRGTPRPLPPGVELSGFRIVQEALSNVMRHAPGARARVEIGYYAAGLTVRVTNTTPDGPGTPGTPGSAPLLSSPSRSAGHGLLGMRERTAMLGGELAEGPLPGGGYEVSATLPLEDGS